MKAVSCSGTEAPMTKSQVMKPSIRHGANCPTAPDVSPRPSAGLWNEGGLWQCLLYTSGSQPWEHFSVIWKFWKCRFLAPVVEIRCPRAEPRNWCSPAPVCKVYGRFWPGSSTTTRLDDIALGDRERRLWTPVDGIGNLCLGQVSVACGMPVCISRKCLLFLEKYRL